jgi:peptidoglycan/xylan/chitin deacetylase (PgdA/CDA1 family)
MLRSIRERFTVRTLIKRPLHIGLLTVFLFLAVPAVSSAATVVSLEFDDGLASQTTAAVPLLASHNMKATFFLISSQVGQPGYMTAAQVQSLAAGGNEIGGHSVNHLDLTTLSNDEATREVCADRIALYGLLGSTPGPTGAQVTDFAYPFGDTTAAVEADLAKCGYNSARSIGGIKTPFACPTCAVAETIPPADAYNTSTPDSIQATWTLSQIESLVTQAELGGGGWVQLVMHQVCTRGSSGCDPTYSIDPTTLGSLLTWLSTQPVSIETVHQVIGGTAQPTQPGPQVPLPPSGNLVQNPSLEQTAVNGNGVTVPNCWQFGGSLYPTSGGTGTVVTTGAQDGLKAATVSIAPMTQIGPGDDARLESMQDLGGCAPMAQASHSYVFSAWYKSNATVYMVAYLRNKAGTWTYWADNAGATHASTGWTQATWTTPAVPSDDYTGISVAISLRTSSFITTTATIDNLSLTDTDTTPPTVSLTAPTANATVGGNVTLSTSTADASGIRSVNFVVNGTPIAASSTSPGTYTATWDSKTSNAQSAVISVVATDTAGNVTQTAPVTVTVDNLPRSMASSPAVANGALAVRYTAADHPGGSGLARVDLYVKVPGASDYTKVASDTSGQGSGTFAYTATGGEGIYGFYTLATGADGTAQPAPLSANTSTLVDMTAPGSSVGATPGVTNSTAITIPYTAADNTGGSGLAEVDLYVKAPGASGYTKTASNTSGQAAGSFAYTLGSGDGSYSFYTLATDKVGNVQSAPTTTSAVTLLDSVAPTSTISSPPPTTNARSMTLAFTAADTAGGSGLAEVALYAQAPGATGYTLLATDRSGQGSGSFQYYANGPDGAYRFYTLATDKAGNVQSSASASQLTVTLTTASPVAKRVLIAHPGHKGTIRKGDTITFRYSKPLSLGTVFSGWRGQKVSVQVRLTGTRNTTLTVWSGNGRKRVALGSVSLGRGYIASSPVVYSATMTARGADITVKLGKTIKGRLASAKGPNGKVVWTPARDATDPVGNHCQPHPVADRGPAF